VAVRNPNCGSTAQARECPPWYLPLAFGDRIFEDDDHLIVPSVRENDGEERSKVVGIVGGKLFTGIFVWRGELPRFISVRRSNKSEESANHATR